MTEIWKYIKGYGHKYLVSNKGQVYANPNITSYMDYGYLIYHGHKGHIKKQTPSGDGYLVVCLSKNHKYKVVGVHRLVAKTFLPNPHHYPIVNHKDENKQNNVVSNLEWCTSKYNIRYGTCVLRNFLTNAYNYTCNLNTHLLTMHDLLIFQRIHSLLKHLHCIDVK